MTIHDVVLCTNHIGYSKEKAKEIWKELRCIPLAHSKIDKSHLVWCPGLIENKFCQHGPMHQSDWFQVGSDMQRYTAYEYDSDIAGLQPL